MKKVGIVNRTNLINFGSVLQVFALAEAVKLLGYDTEVIWEEGTLSRNFDIRPNKIISIIFKLITHPKFVKSALNDLKYINKVEISESTIKLFSDFVNNYISRRFYKHRNFKKIGHNNNYYKFICGSDQVWCSTTLYPDPLMYLRFAKPEKRVAYAPSLGRSYIPEYNKRTLKKYISQIPNISIRETEGAQLIKDLTGKEVPIVLDPTLLFDKLFWGKYSNTPSCNDYVLCYFLNEPADSVQEEIMKFANGRKVVMLRSKLPVVENTYANWEYPEAGPGEFIGYISRADFIFTDSYHGMLFCINFEKNFLSVERVYGEFDQSTRQKSIMELLGITANYNLTGKVTNPVVDYNQVMPRLDKMRQISHQYLMEALK